MTRSTVEEGVNLSLTMIVAKWWRGGQGIIMAMGLHRWANRARATLVASLSAGLAACMQTAPAPPPSAPPPVAAVEPPRDLPPPAPHPARKPAQPVLAALPPAAPPEPTPPATVDRLQGLDQDTTMAMLGEPEQRVESPPAQLWRYASRGCELDLYFYLDLQSREMRVLHYEVRVTDGSERTQQRCYGELIAARRADEARSADRPR